MYALHTQRQTNLVIFLRCRLFAAMRSHFAIFIYFFVPSFSLHYCSSRIVGIAIMPIIVGKYAKNCVWVRARPYVAADATFNMQPKKKMSKERNYCHLVLSAALNIVVIAVSSGALQLHPCRVRTNRLLSHNSRCTHLINGQRRSPTAAVSLVQYIPFALHIYLIVIT